MKTDKQTEHMRRMLAHGERQQAQQRQQAAEFQQGCEAMWSLFRSADLSQARSKISRRIR